MRNQNRMPAIDLGPAFDRYEASGLSRPNNVHAGASDEELIPAMVEAAKQFKATTQRVQEIEQRIAASGGAEVANRLATIEQIVARIDQGGGSGSAPAPRAWSDDLVANERFNAFVKEGAGKARFDVQAAVTSATGSGGDLVQRQRIGISNLPQRRLRVRDVLPVSSTTSNMLEFLKQKTRTNNAAMVAEGALKPESVLAWEAATAPVRTLATLLPATKQIFDDAPQFQSLVDNQLRYMLAEKEEAQLLMGDGTGQNLLGLFSQATAYSAPFDPAGTETMLDVLLLAMAQLAQTGYETDFIIVNPLDWTRMQMLKDGDGRYLGNGPFSDADVARLWQTPVVPTQGMTVDKFLVGSRLAGEIRDRQQAVVEISFDHEDFFARNMVMFRAEERLGLAVYRPEALIAGDFGNVT
ncbi:nucleoid-structuring protein H-NS [Lysobacter xinjiangensis]|uniref:Nucleoid-structuring protein H-NS n=1 Tax=Cognatilysobacter xinjiangensis TaxID=546892 RepID=A0ABQ3BST5_9GAMM|nr:phage major capsid protein [Lysobacter xinjiangensis]GGZ56057.1 nucleoid-structuring protein H-NS [Lysobacter xinjiangensis]